MAAATAMLDVTYTIPSWAGSGVPLGGEPFNVLIIGAGNINFGSGEGPWNHSFRIEQKLGPRLKIVGLVDPFVERSTAVLAKKRASFVASAYNETGIYKTPEDFSEDLNRNQSLKPNFIVVGCPPAFRGSDEPGRDLEIRLLKLFPGTPFFVEKPISSGDIGKAFTVSRAISESKILCSVGYMLRYLKAVQEMKKIIRENKLTVMATIARYACAYESIIKPDWWNKALSGGPVIEQGTHFCDLSRYFGGDVDISSIQATSIEWDEDVGKLSKIGFDENTISPENRIPRVTMANWKYKNGAVGSLTHLATLQGVSYSCEIEVYCDGYLLKLIDPYNLPVLHVRRPGSDVDEIHRFEGDDPFFSEISTFVDVIEQSPNTPEILSSFEDACKSYELTWAIRLASEKNRAHRNKDSYRRREDLGM